MLHNINGGDIWNPYIFSVYDMYVLNYYDCFTTHAKSHSSSVINIFHWCQ